MGNTLAELNHEQAKQLVDYIVARIKRRNAKKPFYICILDNDGEILQLIRYNHAGSNLRQAAYSMARCQQAQIKGEGFSVGIGIDYATRLKLTIARYRPNSWVSQR